MSYQSTVLADGALSLWTQGDTSGTTMTDVAAVSSGTYVNTPTLQQATIPGASPGNAVKYASASTQYATAPLVAGNTTTDTFSMELWVKRTTTGAIMGLFNRVQSTAARSAGPLIRFNASDKIELVSSQVSVIGATTAALTDTTSFHHIVWTKNGATNKLYLDGSDVTPTITNATFAAPGSGAKYEIAADGGSVDGGNPFNGTLAFVAIYNTAISAATVLAHYNLGAGVTSSAVRAKPPIAVLQYFFSH